MEMLIEILKIAGEALVITLILLGIFHLIMRKFF